ncbi:general stress protein [Pseudanabaena yagii]|uniref:DUF1269 domain-containing protein n=1 Tax=Pseudanabaena yagii GIHE-NHR1 TaxID=2722753 RepID=A0ABX1LVM2_9CYAN|nr:general stress protein [Pseudanabaena yagii]NMF60218.1 DUF1269 domain-containing protein [Pseudanabaena yagii GIHE-NHR1]
MTVAQQNKRAIGTFSNHSEAETALRELRDSNFPMDKVSVVGQDIDRKTNIAGADGSNSLSDLAEKHNKADQGAATGAATGGAVGGLTGLLVGLGMVAIPGVGPIMLAGAAATTLATTLAGGAIGAATGGIVGALVGMGIPEDRAKKYSDRIEHGDYLVMVEGSNDDVQRAQKILSHRGINDWGIYDDNRETHNSRSVIDGNPNR